MREEYYQNFFYVLKKFATYQNYKISYNVFRNDYELRLEKENVIFYVTSNNEKKYVSLKDVYKIIREHILEVLSKNQKYKYKYHSKIKEKNISMNELQSKIYKRLIDLFTPYLYDEYIVPTNVLLNVENEVIRDCFQDVVISVSFLRKIIETVILSENSIIEGRICVPVSLRNEKLNLLIEEHYISVKEEKGEVVEILLNEKFLNTLKKMMLSFTY